MIYVFGQDVTDNTRQEIAREINEIEPTAQIELSYVPVKSNKYVIVIVAKSGIHAPYTYYGRAFQRNQSTTGSEAGVAIKIAKHIRALSVKAYQKLLVILLRFSLKSAANRLFCIKIVHMFDDAVFYANVFSSFITLFNLRACSSAEHGVACYGWVYLPPCCHGSYPTSSPGQ